jgi:hypothetical protein
MVGTGAHAFFDFGLRVPVNAIFLVLLAALALTTLDEGFKGRATGKGLLLRCSRFKRWVAGLGLVITAVVCLGSSVQIVRYGLAQHYCMTEIDTVNRRRAYGASAGELQKALELNPLNSEYWLNLAMFIDMGDSSATFEKNAAFADGAAIHPETLPDWEASGLAPECLQDWAYEKALTLSPASGELWLLWADHLWENLQNDEGRDSALVGKTARCYGMAVELRPESEVIRQRAMEFSQWQKQKDLPEL